MGDSNLSPEEQKVYDRYKQKCERDFKSLPEYVQFSCVVQKKQLEQDARSKQQEKNSCGSTGRSPTSAGEV